jgi:hypothetical protein
MPDGKTRMLNKNRLRKYIAEVSGDGAYLSHERDVLQEELDTIKRLQLTYLTTLQEKQAQLELVNARQAVAVPEAVASVSAALAVASASAKTTPSSCLLAAGGDNAQCVVVQTVIEMQW